MLDTGDTELDATADEDASATGVLLPITGDAWIEVLSAINEEDPPAVEVATWLEEDETVARMLDARDADLDSTADEDTSTSGVLLLKTGDAWIGVLSAINEEDSAAVEVTTWLDVVGTVA